MLDQHKVSAVCAIKVEPAFAEENGIIQNEVQDEKSGVVLRLMSCRAIRSDHWFLLFDMKTKKTTRSPLMHSKGYAQLMLKYMIK